jgi:arylformamidase
LLSISEAPQWLGAACMMDQDLYRIRDFVPDFDAIAAEIAARSRALVRDALIWSGTSYGPGAREGMDILLPRRLRQGAPVHVFVHGGYWRSGDKADYTCVAAPVLAAGGIAAIIEYDLMPGARLATLVDQVRRATAFVAAQALGLGGDPARLTVSGHSAGAHLASYLAATGVGESEAPRTPLAGMLLLSGIYDLSGIPRSFLRHEARMTEAEAAAYSPLTSRQQAGPKRLIAYGAEETRPFHDQAKALHRKLRMQGLPAELLAVPGLNHMNVVLDLADPAGGLGQRLSALVEDRRPGLGG